MKLKGKALIIFLFTYIIATVIRRLTGINHNIFVDKFNLINFIKDFSTWTISYALVTLIVFILNR